MRKKGIPFVAISMVLALFSLSGCASGDAGEEKEKPIVAVTILPEQAFAEAVCQDLAEVVTLVPPGSSPESYEATPAQMEGLNKADVYFSIGVPAEDAILSDLSDAVKVVDLADKSDEAYAPLTFSAGERDPHIWLSPKRAKVMVQAIADVMAEIDPDNAESYRKNATDYIKEIDTADVKIREVFSGLNKNIFIVSHPAFGYFADEYGLNMYALEEEGKEATAQRLQEMIDLAKREGISTIFSQAEDGSQLPDTFSEEVGGQKVLLDPLSLDYIQNLQAIASAIAKALE